MVLYADPQDPPMYEPKHRCRSTMRALVSGAMRARHHAHPLTSIIHVGQVRPGLSSMSFDICAVAKVEHSLKIHGLSNRACARVPRGTTTSRVPLLWLAILDMGRLCM